MKSVSIYTITRNQNIEQLQKLERQLSGRDYFLKMREWELESMKALTAELETCMEDVYALRFFYSFQIPRLGKEFDLLQIKEDQIVNIELKVVWYQMRLSADSFAESILSVGAWKNDSFVYLYQQPEPSGKTDES